MNDTHRRLRRLGSASWLLGAIAFGACSPAAPPNQEESLGTSRAAVFVNGGFEIGAAGAAPPSWTVATYINPGITVQTPQTRAGLNLAAGGAPLTTEIAGTAVADPDLGATASLRYCRYGAQCAKVNSHGTGGNVNALTQTMTVGAGDVDPSDGQIHVRFAVAPVLQNPAHAANQQPYYFVQVTNVTKGNAILYSDFNLSAQAGVPWKTINGGTANELDYVDWSLVDIAPGTAKLASGDQITLEVMAAGCQPGGHYGELYVDGVGSTVPGLFVSGTAPSQANAGTNITYTLTYKNGSASAETGVVVDFTTPPGTTFQGITPPAGVTCVTPAVGSAGTIVCTVPGSFAAGASGSLGVTVAIDAAATGQVVEGNYDVHSTQETPLLGNKIVTTIGCTADAQCATGNWCNESANKCTPTLANGTSLPTDGTHTTPTLNGTCGTGVGALVCTSGVCDAVDSKCGLANGDGACTSGTGATVCRSGVCDPDLKCGYATGDGPCTSGTAATVCRSGTCSSNGKCEPAGGCNVDADCTGGKWCLESTHTCTAKLGNGTAMPTDGPHASPTLDGTCTTAAATLVCTAGVCDTKDAKCAFADGDGSCTTGTASVVCRSGACSVAGSCMPAGGCNADGDCAAGKWCLESTHTCTAKLANGTPLPTDAPHTTPTLDGKCSTAAAALVCVSAVCDTTDDGCGFKNGDGPCTVATGATLCRSGACSVAGTCMNPGTCNADGDCAGGNWCAIATHTCTPKLANGVTLPTDAPHTVPTLNGKCAAAAATLVCTSAVCDTADDKCGFANADGACTAANAGVVCRSGSCGADGKCGLANGEATCTVANGGTICRAGVCDTDGKCGLADGDGTCTAANQATVCRSGKCGSTSGKCVPSGGCASDADCTGGKWCNVSTLTCTAQVANAGAVPTDPKHGTPTLDGTCTAAAATLTCVSGVCDPRDNECGFDVGGTSACTSTNAATVCRSGFCSTSGKCMPAAGCLVDGDCPMAWCDITLKTCAPKVDNGAALPADPGHGTTPTLDGKCNADAATLVCKTAACDPADDKCGLVNGTACTAGQDAKCRSAICDTDGKCGLADGDGPCTSANQTTVCRSGLCSASGKCLAAGACAVDADCPSTGWCNVTAKKCADKIDNGGTLPTDPGHGTSPTLDGKCNADAGALVCKTAACDPADDECALANGTACTAGQDAKCRAGVCDGDGKCGKVDGETCTGATECRTSQCTDGKCGNGGGGDAGPVDSGPEDGGPVADSGAPIVKDGTLQGGGCSTQGATGTSGGLSAGALGAIVALGAALRLRRQRRD